MRDNIRSLIHGLRSGLNRELKREAEGKLVKWKFFHALSYMKEDIVKSTKVGRGSPVIFKLFIFFLNFFFWHKGSDHEAESFSPLVNLEKQLPN